MYLVSRFSFTQTAWQPASSVCSKFQNTLTRTFGKYLLYRCVRTYMRWSSYEQRLTARIVEPSNFTPDKGEYQTKPHPLYSQWYYYNFSFSFPVQLTTSPPCTKRSTPSIYVPSYLGRFLSVSRACHGNKWPQIFSHPSHFQKKVCELMRVYSKGGGEEPKYK